MATTLPTLTVTDAQAQRMLAAYGTTDNYKAWLRSQIIDFVKAYEVANNTQQMELQAQQIATDVETALS